MKKIFILWTICCSIFVTHQIQATDMMCTMEYNPVCWMPKFDCPQDDGPIVCSRPADQTYSNRCVLDSQEAAFLYEWECWSQNKETILPELTDKKYYVWDTNKCQVMKYICDTGWKWFSDEVWCWCEKKDISEEQEKRIDSILASFFEKLENKWYSSEKIESIIDVAIQRFISLIDSHPQHTWILNYAIQELSAYKK